MQHSAEVRWFHRGVPGAATVAWFADGKTPEVETRRDRYFRFPGCEAGGVKLRSYGGKPNFEIKLLRGAAEPVSLPSGVAGRADCWVKWSYGEDPVHPLVAALMSATDGFVDVEKTRSQRKFSADSGRLVELAAGVQAKTGAGVELTRLVVRGEPWWSFAFEAFGPPEGVRATLDAVARDFLGARRPVDAFTTANSCSYPAWLAAY